MAVKQTIPSNSNPAKSLTFSKLKGVDLSSSPFEVSTSRATHMINMINRNGVNHKRKGLQVVHDFGVSYMQLIKLKDSSGLNTYRLSITNNGTTLRVEPRDTGATYATSNIGLCDNRWCKAYEQNGCAYFLSKGVFKKIYVDSNQVHIDDVADNAYVPTTTISINNEYDVLNNGATSKTVEDANLLTTRRKNSFYVQDIPAITMCYILVNSHRIFNTQSTTSLVYQFIMNDNTQEVLSIDALGKNYISAQLQLNKSYTFKIIRNGSEESNFTISNLIIKSASSKSLKYNGEYYGSFATYIAVNGEVTIDGVSESNPASIFYNKLITEKVDIYSEYILDTQYLDLSVSMPEGTIITPTQYPYKTYYGYNIYVLDANIKKDTYIDITIKDKESGATYTGSIGYRALSRWYTPLYLTKSTDSQKYTVGFLKENRLLLSGITPLAEGEDNVFIEYTADIDDTISAVTDNLYSTTWAMDGNSDRLFVYGNQEAPALMYFSGFRNFEYFPFSNSVLVGNTSNPISGISILSDSTIAVHKSKNYKEANIFYLTPTDVTINDADRVTLKTESGAFGETPLNPNCCVLFGDDHLIISENGVFAITPGSNIKIGERYAYERSSLVHDSFVRDITMAEDDTRFAVNDICCYVYDEKLFISTLENRMYVADLKYRTSPRDQDMNNTYNYEWWVWEGIPRAVRFVEYSHSNDNTETIPTLCWFTHNINSSGTYISNDIIKMIHDDKYRDEYYDIYTSSNWTAGDDGQMVLNSSVYTKINDGAVIEIITQNDSVVDYEVEKIGSDTIKLKDVSGNYINSTTAATLEDLGFRLINYVNVVSEWYTPILNMGTSLYSKNLLSTTLTFEPDTEGTVKFGYLTRRNAAKGIPYKQSNTLSVGGVDFTDIDFTDFSFATNFAGARTLKTRVRNFNYIQFRIKSEDDKDCALNNFVVTYNIGRKNKGVR